MGEHPVVAWYRAAVAAAWGGGRARDAKRRGKVAFIPVGAAGEARGQEQARRDFARLLGPRTPGRRVAKHKEQRDAGARRWRSLPASVRRAAC